MHIFSRFIFICVVSTYFSKSICLVFGMQCSDTNPNIFNNRLKFSIHSYYQNHHYHHHYVATNYTQTHKLNPHNHLLVKILTLKENITLTLMGNKAWCSAAGLTYPQGTEQSLNQSRTTVTNPKCELFCSLYRDECHEEH